ncbi:MAG TPA: SPFH domain-containing protein, partial [Terriglobales bacterium]|nr:SPFH domain-containing protein [Terriglobales bacterium]
MLALKYFLLAAAIALFASAAAIVAYDLFRIVEYRRRAVRIAAGETIAAPKPLRWRLAMNLSALALAPLLISLSIVVVPSGMAAIRVSQISGTRPGTLYPGVHFVKPLIESTAMYDVREHVFTTALAPEATKKDDAAKRPEPLKVQSREGLTIGLAISVRYRLDPRRLDYIHANLPTQLETEVVQPVIASTFREMAPNYTVRDIFSAQRDRIRDQAAQIITRQLASDGVLVREVMLRDIQLPPEYAKGLEGLLLKEQESERMGVETDIQAKNVRLSELQAEAQKVQQVKEAEGQAQVRVLQAKGEADAMQYTLPLKEKQIQQSRLEAEARKEATIKNAEAAAEAKVIDSKAELQRRNLLADAEANRIRITAVADAERMKSEAAVLKQNPLLINKIVAERLSDKIQIMMVPTDGKFFFNDVLRNG